MGGGDIGLNGPAILSEENLEGLDKSIRNVMRTADEVIGNGKVLDVDRDRYFEMGRLVSDLDREYKVAINQLIEKYGKQIQNVNKLVKTKMK